MNSVPDDVTICVTSCGRLDLLERTIRSFAAYNAGGRYLISEDSTDAAVIAAVKEKFPFAEVLSGPDRLGLMGSIDRLYSAAHTPYIFHLEDDWEFTGAVFWKDACRALEDRPEIANVSVRAFDEIKPKYRDRSDEIEVGGVKFQLMRGDAHPEFFGWSSNPGLIKADLYRRHAPFGRLLHDQMSAEIKKAGGRVAYLLPGVARHIGHGRNVTDPTMPPRPTSRPGKWLRAIKKKLYYAGLRKEPF
jgi:hypothetical protein